MPAVIEYLALLVFTWMFVTGAASVQFIKNVCGVGPDSKPKHVVLKVLKELFNCCLCSGFWVGIIFYQSILMGCLVSFGSEVFHRITSKLMYQ